MVPTATDWSNCVGFDDYPDIFEPPLFSSEWAHCTKEALVDMPALLAVPLPITCTDIVNIVVITNSVNSVIIVKCLTFIIKNVNNLESKATILSAKRKVDSPLAGHCSRDERRSKLEGRVSALSPSPKPPAWPSPPALSSGRATRSGSLTRSCKGDAAHPPCP